MLAFICLVIIISTALVIAYRAGRVDERRRAEREIEARWRALQAKPRVTRPDGTPLSGGVFVAGDELIMAPMEEQ